MQGQEPDDRLIRNLVILGSSAAVVGILAVAMALTVMASANFNILQWLE